MIIWPSWTNLLQFDRRRAKTLTYRYWVRNDNQVTAD
jgi:hypothetical protein